MNECFSVAAIVDENIFCTSAAIAPGIDSIEKLNVAKPLKVEGS